MVWPRYQILPSSVTLASDARSSCSIGVWRQARRADRAIAASPLARLAERHVTSRRVAPGVGQTEAETAFGHR